MRRFSIFLVAAALLAALIACNASGAVQPTATLPPTVTPTLVMTATTSASVTSAPPSAVPSSTATTGSAAPTATTKPAQPTAVPPTAQPTSAGVSEVNIYLIAVGDNGASGPLVGCGDSVVAVKRQLSAPTRAPLRAALEQLLSLHDENYGQSGLRNALYGSNLAIDNVTIENEVAKIALSGTMSLAGECDDPRFKAQLEYTALQFSTVKSVEITVNDQPLDKLLGGQG
jgi:spore germination protein GerM